MKKEWAKSRLYFISIFLMSLSFLGNASECSNFNGEWFGSCSNDELMNLKIDQDSCHSIKLKGQKLVIGKGHVGTTRNIYGQLIEEKKMASYSPKKRKLVINSLVTMTKSPDLFHVDISKNTLTKKDDETLIYTVFGKKVQTHKAKIVHSDYSWSCFLRRSNF